MRTLTCVTALPPWTMGQGRQCRQDPEDSWNDLPDLHIHIYYYLHTNTRPKHGSNDVSGCRYIYVVSSGVSPCPKI